MLEQSNAQPSFDEIVGTSMEELFKDIDSAIKSNEVVLGSYKYKQEPGYGNSGDIPEGGTTKINIKADNHGVVDVENSFIRGVYEIDVGTTTARFGINTNNVREIFVGVMFAPEWIRGYNIYSNTDVLQTVTDARYEWNTVYLNTKPEVMNGDHSYSTVDKIRKHCPDIPGVYLDLTNFDTSSAANPLKVKIPFEIPLKHFTIFKNLRYIPYWFGLITLELTFTAMRGVWMPVITDSQLADPALKYIDVMNTLNNGAISGTEQLVDLGFGQFNVPIRNLPTVDATTKVCSGYTVETLKVMSGRVTKIDSILAVHTLRTDVSARIQLNYTQRPLIVHVNTMSSMNFQSPIGDLDTVGATVLSTAFKKARTGIVVFSENLTYSASKFPNPMLDGFYLNINGVQYPPIPYRTIDDPRMRNLILDGLNINSSDETSLPSDIRSSMQPYAPVYEVPASGASMDNPNRFKYTTGNQGSFAIVIPFADGNAFQGGLDSGTANWQVELNYTRSNANRPRKIAAKPFAQPVLTLINDHILTVYPMKPAGRPQMQITDRPLEEVVLTSALV